MQNRDNSQNPAVAAEILQDLADVGGNTAVGFILLLEPNMKHPIQPIETDASGTERFKPNAIVRYLLDTHPAGMNELASMNFTDDDRQ